MIIPSILATDEGDLLAKYTHPVITQAGCVHIDILDGSFANATCAHNPKGLKPIPGAEIELHLMTQNPLPHLIEWTRHIPIHRAIVHHEIARTVGTLLEQIHVMRIKPAFALNPESPVETIEKHKKLLESVLIMGVHPGASGQAFLGEPILSKIKRTKLLFPDLPITLDGGVSAENIESIIAAGASRLVVSSALWKEADPCRAHEALQKMSTLL